MAATLSPQVLAARVVERVSAGALLDRALETQAGPGSAARGLVQEMAYGTVRWWFQLEAIAAGLLERPLRPKDRDLYALLLVGLYQLRFMRTPPAVAVNETVAAAAALGKPWARGLINACLRGYGRARERLDLRIAADPVAATSHPAWLLEALERDWPGESARIVQANNAHPPLVLRVNCRRQGREAYLGQLRAAGHEAASAPHTECGLMLRRPVAVEALPGFAAGAVSVQDGAAQLAAELLDARPGERVLDACAAPGGKTAHILERTPGLAELVAVDDDARRLARLREGLGRLGLQARVVDADASAPASWWDRVPFDRILLDAPCSGTGVIRRHPDIKLHRSPAAIAQRVALQARLLDALWPLLGRGGKLLYVTCSIMPAENAAQAAAFLARHADAEESPLPEHLGRRCTVGRQILPGEDDMDGFYYACLHKT